MQSGHVTQGEMKGDFKQKSHLEYTFTSIRILLFMEWGALSDTKFKMAQFSIYFFVQKNFLNFPSNVLGMLIISKWWSHRKLNQFPILLV